MAVFLRKLKIFFIFVTFMFVNAVQAEENTDGLCESLAMLGKKIMNARQSGVEMSTQIGSVDEKDAEEDDKGVKNINRIAKVYIFNAYQYPRVHDESMRREVIVEFGNYIYSACYKAQSELQP